jgi:hypothetical protein
MESLDERFRLIERHVANAVSAVERDEDASPVLKAVVRELHRKQTKALGLPRDRVTQALREAVIEVEQAADSAKLGADADPRASPDTKRAIEDAHLAFCMLKADLLAGPTG